MKLLIKVFIWIRTYMNMLGGWWQMISFVCWLYWSIKMFVCVSKAVHWFGVARMSLTLKWLLQREFHEKTGNIFHTLFCFKINYNIFSCYCFTYLLSSISIVVKFFLLSTQQKKFKINHKRQGLCTRLHHKYLSWWSWCMTEKVLTKNWLYFRLLIG